MIGWTPEMEGFTGIRSLGRPLQYSLSVDRLFRRRGPDGRMTAMEVGIGSLAPRGSPISPPLKRKKTRQDFVGGTATARTACRPIPRNCNRIKWTGKRHTQRH